MVRAERLRRYFRWLLRVELRRPPRALLAVVPGLIPMVGCVAAMAGRGRLDEAVLELNQAARFGRSDVAFQRVALNAREKYAEHHRGWGDAVRIVDVDYTGTEKMTEEEAVVVIAYHWFRPAENTLHTTSLRQTWRPDPKAGTWTLTDERCVSGDPGLLGEAPPPAASSQADHDATAARLDAVAPRHLPTTVIR